MCHSSHATPGLSRTLGLGDPQECPPDDQLFGEETWATGRLEPENLAHRGAFSTGARHASLQRLHGTSPQSHFTTLPFPFSAGRSYNSYAAPPLAGGYGYGGFSPFFPGYAYGGFGGPALLLGGGGGLFNVIFFAMVASFVASAFRGSRSNNTSEDDEEDDGFSD